MRKRQRKEKYEDEVVGEIQITVTVALFFVINFQLQLQSCFRCELVLHYSYRSRN